MKRNKVLLLAALFLFIVGGKSFAQTATPTATATASPTPTGIATPTGYVLQKNVTNFAYIGTNNGQLTISSTVTSTGAVNIGGRVIKMRAGTALTIGQAVQLSTSADNTVIVATSQTASHVIGVVVGRMQFSQDQIGFSPASGDVAIIQIDGIVQMVTDGVAVTRGNTVRVSANVTGGVTNGSAAGTADAAAFGVAINAAAASSTAQKIFVLLETARNF